MWSATSTVHLSGFRSLPQYWQRGRSPCLYVRVGCRGLAMGFISRVIRVEALEVAKRVGSLMWNEDARFAVEGTIAHPEVSENSFALLATPGTLARAVTSSLESTTRKGIVAHVVSLPKALLDQSAETVEAFA